MQAKTRKRKDSRSLREHALNVINRQAGYFRSSNILAQKAKSKGIDYFDYLCQQAKLKPLQIGYVGRIITRNGAIKCISQWSLSKTVIYFQDNDYAVNTNTLAFKSYQLDSE